jgi:hypothetical protein
VRLGAEVHRLHVVERRADEALDVEAGDALDVVHGGARHAARVRPGVLDLAQQQQIRLGHRRLELLAHDLRRPGHLALQALELRVVDADLVHQ